jgi:hypothetical protein
VSIKQLVNDFGIYESFLKELDDKIASEQKQLVNEVDVSRIYRHQGAIMALQRLKKLREEVNGRK